MVIAKTPFRISFFGGGTDFPDYFEEYGGKVLSTTIDKYCYVNIRHLPHFFDYKNEIIYSKIEQVKNVSDIEHPMVKNILKLFNIENLKVTYDADLPARTGLGTSSSFAVGLINAICKYKKIYDVKFKNNLSDNVYDIKKNIADLAIYVERVMCNEAGGVQDQIAASFGGLSIINLKKQTKKSFYNIDIMNFNGYEYEVEKLNIGKEKIKRLSNNLLLYFTGIARNSFEVQKETEKVIKKNNDNLKIMNGLVDKAYDILIKSDNYIEFGKLLDYTWELKRGLSKGISNDYIDDIYMKAKKAGAIGGKLLGAGGGGFLLFYVEDEKKANVENALKDFMKVPFNFEEDGTKIIFDNEENS